MISISLLLLLLVVIQIVWLNRAIKTQADEKILRVVKALEAVELKLKDANTCFEFFTKPYINPGEGIYILKQEWDSTGFKGMPDTVNMLYDYHEFRNKNYKKEVPYKFPNFKSSEHAYAEISIKFFYELEDTLAFNKERDTFNNISRGNFRDAIYNRRPVEQVFDMDEVDTLIQTHLHAENVTGAYGFAFIDEQADKIAYCKNIADTSIVMNSPYSIHLFAGNKFMKPYQLALVFPSAPGIGSVNGLLLLSIAVILLLIFSFYAFIKLYLEQTKLSEMKSDFIQNLTHEFNTPMANISLAIETLEENGQGTNKKLDRILNIISTESLRLRENIERALQVATMEKGSLHLRMEETDMVVMVQTAESAYQMQYEQLGGRIELHLPESAVVDCDETHILNCICNLLDNSLKYRNGIPQVVIKVEDKTDSILLRLEDNGIGMNAETQKHIFEKFYRAHQGDIHNTKGFGLGLNYVKGIIDAHGGHINVRSKPGVGTKFTIMLPKNRKYDKH